MGGRPAGVGMGGHLTQSSFLQRCIAWFRRRYLWVALAAVVVFFLGAFRYFVPTDPGSTHLEPSGDGKVLVVVIRGLAGLTSNARLEAFVRKTFPQADFLQSTYHPSPFANIDPRYLADRIELGINQAYSERHYEKIVLVGYSMGAVVLRKTLVWGYGVEDDREPLGRKGRREWVSHVDRFVSLAGVNRGWTIDPKPVLMRPWAYATYFVAEKFAQLTGTGGLLLSMRRGAPFISDLRVQWIRLAHLSKFHGEYKLPPVIHLLGDTDNIVSREDSEDLAAAKSTVFITLPKTDHETIISELSTGSPKTLEVAVREERIRGSLLLRPDQLPVDQIPVLQEYPKVTRVIYILHGIRDYGVWTGTIRTAIERATHNDLSGTVVGDPQYGYFPMMPFLLYWDRQKNVRKFMDEYTENLAKFPNVDRFDFLGHSNGTYILASALQHYKTLRVGNILFAGSVVPIRYPWKSLIQEGRVVNVRNVVASTDWVVALFPRFFEQIAEWLGISPENSFLDIGSAGFRGFEDSKDPMGSVRDIRFVAGGHGAGVDVMGSSKLAQSKLAGIVDYLLRGDDRSLSIFREREQPASALDLLSNISWVVWLILVTFLVYAARFAGATDGGLSVYGVVVLGILYSF